MAAWSTTAVSGLTTSQINTLSETQLQKLTGTQIGALTTGQLAVLTVGQIASLSTTQAKGTYQKLSSAFLPIRNWLRLQLHKSVLCRRLR
jgi:hypothetical protein